MRDRMSIVMWFDLPQRTSSVARLVKKHTHMVKLVSSNGNLFSYFPNAQIWHWPELLPSACRPRSPALDTYSAQSLKSPQAIPSSSVSYGHHLQTQVCCPPAWTTRFACKASMCSTTLWNSVPAKPSTRSVRHDTQLLKPHRWVALSTSPVSVLLVPAISQELLVIRLPFLVAGMQLLLEQRACR